MCTNDRMGDSLSHVLCHALLEGFEPPLGLPVYTFTEGFYL